MNPVRKITGNEIKGDIITDVAKRTIHSGTQAKTPEEVVNNIRKKY